MYKRKALKEIIDRLKEPRRFIQVLCGPRQTGKTTLALQATKDAGMKSHYAVSDEPDLKDRVWIEQQWQSARLLADGKERSAFLVIDEIQKIPGWSETVKKLWDEDTRNKVKLHVMLLGSAQLLITKGLGDSLAGRYEAIRVGHWSFDEMADAFGMDIDGYIFFGGYPGAADLRQDEKRWADYINVSLIESVISKDILQMTRIDKPSLLKRLFYLGCVYSGQILSYQKITGQLQDAGNTTTLAHYLDLLCGAGLLCGLQKYSGQNVRQRGSSPKFQALNNALLSAQSGKQFAQARKDREFWGRLTESCVGAHLANSAGEAGYGIFYWSSGNREVDFVLSGGGKTAAIEVKSGNKKTRLPGIEEFSRLYPGCKKYLVGTGGIPVEEFLRIKPPELL